MTQQISLISKLAVNMPEQAITEKWPDASWFFKLETVYLTLPFAFEKKS